MKELLDERGFLAFAAFIGSSQIAEALIQKGVGKKYSTITYSKSA